MGGRTREKHREKNRMDRGGAYVRCCELHLLKGDDSPILSNYSLTLSHLLTNCYPLGTLLVHFFPLLHHQLMRTEMVRDTDIYLDRYECICRFMFRTDLKNFQLNKE